MLLNPRVSIEPAEHDLDMVQHHFTLLPMKIRLLKTVPAVIEEIGTDRVKALTGRDKQHLSNWKASGRFPPDTFLILEDELAGRRCKAPSSLWGIPDPKAAPLRRAG